MGNVFFPSHLLLSIFPFTLFYISLSLHGSSPSPSLYVSLYPYFPLLSDSLLAVPQDMSPKGWAWPCSLAALWWDTVIGEVLHEGEVKDLAKRQRDSDYRAKFRHLYSV